MNVAEMIEWLKTQPQDARVEVLSHSRGSGYYDQGGWCTTEVFHSTIEFMGEHTFESRIKGPYAGGLHFELRTYDGVTTLQLGGMDK